MTKPRSIGTIGTTAITGRTGDIGGIGGITGGRTGRIGGRTGGIIAVVSLLALVTLSACMPAPRAEIGKTLYQTSTITALMEGAYDGDTTLEQLKSHGDFGLGTFDALHGEMVAVGGKFYQVRSDGSVRFVSNSAADSTMKTPFAVVTFFQPDMIFTVDEPVDFNGLIAKIDSRLPSKNLCYAVRVDGVFDYLKARSVPAQQKPYPRLVDAARQQSVFEFINARGSLVGFKMPDFIKGVNIPGWHFHFLYDDAHAGGHVLNLKAKNVTVSVETIDSLDIKLSGVEFNAEPPGAKSSNPNDKTGGNPDDKTTDNSDDKKAERELESVEKGAAVAGNSQ